MKHKTKQVHSNVYRKSIFYSVVASLIAGLSVTGFATAQDGANAVLEEVVVTSRRYAESINDAPLAVNVLGADYIESQGIDTLSDALELTPGATWGHYTMAQPAHTLRGMESYNSGNASLESSVQMVVDGIPLTKAFMMTPPVYDMERIEIMRGPQGTTFGRNASLGLAHFVTAKPSQDFSASAKATIGTRDYYGITGHINGGLTDSIAVRIAANKRQYDGDLEEENTGEPLEGEDNWALRASMTIDPSDTFSAYLKMEHMVDRGKAPARRHESCTEPSLVTPRYFEEYTANCDIWKASISSPPPEGFYQDRDMTFLTTELSWVRGDLNITSLTGYQWGEHAVINDIFASPEVIQDQYVENDGNVFSTEIRIDNHGSDSALRWLAGIYLLEDEEYRMELNNGAPSRGDNAGLQTPASRPPHWLTAHGWSETSSIGLFGEVTFDMGDRTEVSIGGRYTDETKDYDFTNQCYGRAGGCNFPVPLGSSSPGYESYYDPTTDCAANTVDGLCGDEGNPMGIGVNELLHISRSWDDFSLKASISYALNDNLNLYALYSEAFKSGGFHHDARSVGQFFESVLEPEYVDNIEIGLKGSYDAFRYAVTAFVMEQDEAQNSSLLPDGQGGYLTVLSNLGGKKQTGLEIESTWAVSEKLLVGGNIAFYDGELTSGSVVNCKADGNGGTTCLDVSGYPTGMSNTWVLFAEYTSNLSSGASLSFRIDNQYRSEIEAPPERFEVMTLDGSAKAFERPDVNNLGMNLSWTSAQGDTVVSLWGRNMLNEEDFGGFGPASGFWFNKGTSPRNYWGRSRYGLDVRFNF